MKDKSYYEFKPSKDITFEELVKCIQLLSLRINTTNTYFEKYQDIIQKHFCAVEVESVEEIVNRFRGG